MRLKGRVAFISGAAGGIGLAITKAFVEEGAYVAGADIAADTLAAAYAPLPEDKVLAIPTDVTDENAVRSALEKTASHFGKVDALVCNAATATPLNPVEDISAEEWRSALDVNLTSAFFICKHGVKHVRAAGGGSVVIVASQMGKVAWAGQAAYCTTKGGLIQLAKTMALDYAQAGIRVNTLSPGGTATQRLEWRFGNLEEAERQWGPKHPVGRLGRVEEIARGAVFLASTDSEFMTGADLVMDGGYTAW
jgi:NAD(P)-dependent dehydrogenase (short-subunit alcohol dehydrogenase family)